VWHSRERTARSTALAHCSTGSASPPGSPPCSAGAGSSRSPEGDPPQAIAHLESCLVLARGNQAQYLEAVALKGPRRRASRGGRRGSARASWRQARDLFVRIGNVLEADNVEQLMAVG